MKKNDQEGSISLYRKYRPTKFSEIKGQDHIVQVLEGAVEKKTIPHALLFVGSRGTGKTSIARIFASEIGASEMDIYEMDAASNRGIEDIRALKEAVHTLPYESPYKVYIIDEVHMLTKEAFNALLKTLEEPPAHVIFILATTESDKLLDTITSRCQVFTFRAPTRSILQEIISSVAKKEEFTLDDEATALIATSADGSFRDALGITQKVIISSSDDKANADEVAGIIGAPKTSMLMDVVEAFFTKDAEKGLSAVQSAVEANVDMSFFVKLLLERLRAVILVRNNPKDTEHILGQYLTEDRESIERYAKEGVGNINSHVLLRLLETSNQISQAYLPQLPLELVIVDICNKK